MPTLQDILARYWFYLNLTYNKWNWFDIFGKEKLLSFDIANYVTNLFFYILY